MHKIHCWWKDESARKRIGYPLSYAKAKKSLTLHAHGHLRTSLRDFYSSPLIIANLPHSVCYRNHMSHLADLWLSVWMYPRQFVTFHDDARQHHRERSYIKFHIHTKQHNYYLMVLSFNRLGCNVEEALTLVSAIIIRTLGQLSPM